MFNPAQTIVLASGNKGKIAEFAALLADFELEVIGLDAFPDFAEVEETGHTFEENALLKARAASAHSGLVALADDSGLCVEALGGAPGVYSARFSLLESQNQERPDKKQLDAANIAKLLQALREVPPAKRSAFFCSVIAACAPGQNDYITARGEWHGQIARLPLGSHGFGYDPVFFDPILKLTAAQMSMEVKNSRSHRARALRELRLLWPGFWQRSCL